jgi:hypothetical protein
MLRALAVLSVLSFGAQAAHLDTICKSALEAPPVFGEGLVSYRVAEDLGTHYALDTLEGQRVFNLPTKIRSVVSQKETIWVLASDELLQLKKNGTLVASFEMTKSKTMTLAGNLLLIVRSGGVMTAFDINTKKEIWTSSLSEIKDGQALGVAFDGKNAQVVVTSTNEGGFNGVATINPLTGSVLKQTSYDYVRAGVIDPISNVRWFKNQLVINNGGWIHVVTADQLAKGKAMKPRWVAEVVGSREEQHYMMLKGEFFFKENKLVGCGMYNERQGSDIVELTKVFTVVMP